MSGETNDLEAPIAYVGILIGQSPELDKLFEALSLAQGELTDPVKSKTADTGRSGKYSYADLADLLKIIRPVFQKHGLCLLQFSVNPHRGAVTIVTRIGHKSGQWMQSALTLAVADDKPQTLGSAITYGRRYAAGCVAGLSSEDDEDGQIAQNAGRQQQQQPRNRQEMKDDRHAAAGREREQARGAQAAAQASVEKDMRTNETRALDQAAEQRRKFEGICRQHGIQDQDDVRSLMAEFKGQPLSKLPQWLEAKKAEAALASGAL